MLRPPLRAFGVLGLLCHSPLVLQLALLAITIRGHCLTPGPARKRLTEVADFSRQSLSYARLRIVPVHDDARVRGFGKNEPLDGPYRGRCSEIMKDTRRRATPGLLPR
ncbi:hypothetical protein AcW1_007618 [Taiwanofungus camphoratus]|nr:hypothetical protein AcW1_007618 [Antrodia cinnamomea]